MAEWLQRAQSSHFRAIDLGLDRVARVRDAMESDLQCPVALIGGTNGKGSVCAFAEAALSEAGLRPGTFASPHLLRFNERIRIAAVPVADDVIANAYAQVDAARIRAGESLTYFEYSALAAAHVFAEAECDCALLEVGMGGRLDAVNIFAPAVSVTTNIGTDHAEFLGPTPAHIAREKAGIFRANIPAIFGDEKVPDALHREAERIGAKVLQLGRDFFAESGSDGGVWSYRGKRLLANLPHPAMRGAHQLKNAAAAVAMLESLPDRLWPGAGAVRRALRGAALSGRAQVLPGRPAVVLDVAHNPEAAAALERFLFAMGFFPKTTVIVGMMARKDAASFAKALSRRADKWLAVCPAGGDCSAESLARVLRESGCDAEPEPSVSSAFARARSESGENDRIVVAGSFLTVAEFLETVKTSK